MPNPRLAALLATLLAATGCTEAPDVVAVAELSPATDGGSPRSGGADAQVFDDEPPLWAEMADGDCDELQALMDARIPVETLFAATRCEVPLQAVQMDPEQPAPQQLVAQLLNSSSPIDSDSETPSAEQCEQEGGRWWVDGETVHLCPELCDFFQMLVSDLIAASCDAAGGEPQNPAAAG